MLLPIPALVFCRAVLDQFTFPTDLSTHRRPCSIRARAFPTHRRRGFAAAPLPAGARGILLCQRDLAVDPIAHLARAHATAEACAGALAISEREDDSAVEAVAGEADHLAVLCAAGVRAAGGEVCEYVGGGDEDGVREEYLRVGRGLVREEHDERRAPLVEDRAEDEVDLRETGRAPLVLHRVLEARVCRVAADVSGGEGRGRGTGASSIYSHVDSVSPAPPSASPSGRTCIDRRT